MFLIGKVVHYTTMKTYLSWDQRTIQKMQMVVWFGLSRNTSGWVFAQQAEVSACVFLSLFTPAMAQLRIQHAVNCGFTKPYVYFPPSSPPSSHSFQGSALSFPLRRLVSPLWRYNLTLTLPLSLSHSLCTSPVINIWCKCKWFFIFLSSSADTVSGAPDWGEKGVHYGAVLFLDKSSSSFKHHCKIIPNVSS